MSKDTGYRMLDSKKGFKYWAKATVLFIGEGLLFNLGFLIMVDIFVQFFEGRASLGELSILEILFVALFCSLLRRHVTISRGVGFSWSRTIYRPFRNMGWLGLVGLVWYLFLVLDNKSFDEPDLYSIVNSNAEQWMQFLFLLFSVYLATPAIPQVQVDPAEVRDDRDVQ